ncbi:hypothetical protein IQ07DRAFT_204208 [Pyrenochaeta sp. DS3sAY3a]|nr:hypothetical protein IQ07DRAFT_204208 [Pyrenochaeta sp. DS3sAY3a]
MSSEELAACDPCLTRMFEGAINGGRTQDLLCPDPTCKKPVPLETIRAVVSKKVLTLYSRKLMQKSLGENPKARWCTCGHGQIHALGESSPIWRCLSCQKRNCFICRESNCDHLREDKEAMKHMASRIFSNSQETRQAERQLRAAEAANKEEETRTCKKCPWGMCRAPVQKDPGGCAHMTCLKCKMEWCWCCKVIWRNGVRQHLVGCAVTSAGVPKAQLDLSGYADGWDKDEGYDTANDGRHWL